MNKKAQELSIGTLVLIVLGIIVLVLLVLGFSMGWENLFSKIGIFQGSDLSSMVAACKVAVSSQSQTSFCEFKKVKIDGKTKEINCEYVPLALEDKLTCPQTVKNNYCTKVKLTAGGVAEKKDNQYIRDPSNETIQGLKTCPDEKVYFPFSQTVAS